MLFTYVFLNRFGMEQRESYKELLEALRVVARDHETHTRIPLEVFGKGESYTQQELLLLCHKHNLL